MVNTDYASRLQGIIDHLDNSGYKIYSLGGYVDRDVRNQPGVKSVHGFGGAIDINPAENPLGSKLVTDMPSNIGQVAASLGLGWGGNWRSVKDAMHFSVAKNEGGTVDLYKKAAESTMPQARDGGVFNGPMSGYRAMLHGNEAVIPLKRGSVPVAMPRDFTDTMSKVRVMLEQMGREPSTNTTDTVTPDKLSVAANEVMTTRNDMMSAVREMMAEMRNQSQATRSMMEDVVRAQENTVSISQRILRTANLT